MSIDLMEIVSQFGAVGLIGVLWILERRHAATRDRQLAEAHRKLLEENRSFDAMLNVINRNTRAITTLEQTQRQLIGLVQNLFIRPSKERIAPSE